MQIGQLSKRVGVPAKTIRYYEQVGLMPRPDRHENGYRDYGANDEETLRFVVRARTLGFTIRDIGDLLTLWQDRNRASAEVKRLANDHIAELKARIRDLEAMRRTLVDLSERCHGDNRPDCPIIDELAAG